MQGHNQQRDCKRAAEVPLSVLIPPSADGVQYEVPQFVISDDG